MLTAKHPKMYKTTPYSKELWYFFTPFNNLHRAGL